MIEYWRYVSPANVEAYERLGWRDAGAVSGHHGHWSLWMKWDREGEPVEPDTMRVLGKEE